MSGLRGPVYPTRKIKTKTLTGMVFRLVVRSICVELVQAPASTVPPSAVTTLSPTSKTTSGGTSVTTTGTGFSAGATVSLATSATNVTAAHAIFTTGNSSIFTAVILFNFKSVTSQIEANPPGKIISALRYQVTRSFEEAIVGLQGETERPRWGAIVLE